MSILTTYQPWIVLGLVVVVVFSLLLKSAKPALSFMGGAVVLVLIGIVTPEKMLSGFANKQIAIIFILIFITSALRKRFGLMELIDRFFQGVKRPRMFILRMSVVVASLSSVLNNTPIVALFIPYVQSWGKRTGIHPSKFLIPLSYIAMLGGMITLIGTSTNLVLNGFLEQNGEPLFRISDFLIPGLMVTLVGIVYLLVIGYRILPDRTDLIDEFSSNRREYLVETKIKEGSPIVGKTIAEAGLRNLRGVFLLEIIRQGKIISSVEPNMVLMEKDSLVFAGNLETIVDLVDGQQGLYVNEHTNFEQDDQRQIIEAVIPSNSEMNGKSVRDLNFRNRYDAGIIAIHRNGERLSGKIGDMRVQSGDLLLLAVGQRFNENEKARRDLYLVTQHREYEPRPLLPRVAVVITAIILIIFGLLGTIDLFIAAMVLLGMMGITGILTLKDLREEMDFNLLLLLVGALALGEAFLSSGASEIVGNSIMSLIGTDMLWQGILGLYVLTFVLTSFISNAAAVAIAFPIAFSLSHHYGVSGMPIYLAIAFAASCAFATPIGYQTNLMVYGPGRYRFVDFVKVGLPLSVIYSVLALGYIFWAFNIPFS
jgi:di/tricarboxylate transporter